MPQLSSHYLELITDAALRSYWFKKSFRNFLRRCDVPDRLLASWSSEEEGKREFLDRLLPQLENMGDAGMHILNKMADTLMQQQTFPDLATVEDSERKKALARQAVSDLRDFISRQQQEAQEQRLLKEQQERMSAVRAANIARVQTLEKLSLQLTEISKKIGTQEGGYAFEAWFYDLLDYYEVPNRRPYIVGGRQIDGSTTLTGTTYLVELKFTTNQADAPDIDIFRAKILSKADNTMGVMVSMSGYSSIAKNEASRDKTPMLLLDSNHIYMLLSRVLSFTDLVERARRHCSQTGRAYLGTNEFGN